MYAGCPVLWWRKLQKRIDLSTTEVEYIALSQAMSEVIPFMVLMKELFFIFYTNLPKSELFCKVFEYNQSFISVAEYKNCHQKQNILLLSIIIYKAAYRIRLFIYVILIRDNKNWKFK